MKIIHTGDLDISYNMNEEKEYRLKCFLNEIEKSDADLLVIAGDIVETGIEKNYEKASEVLGKINIETILVPGNHDFYYGGNVPFSSYFYDLQTALDIDGIHVRGKKFKKPLFISDNYMLIGICTARRDESGGVIGHGQHIVTESLFKKYGNEKYKILVMHHHLLPIPIGGLENNIIKDVGDIIRMISDCSIDLVLTGHQHHPWACRHSSGINEMHCATVLTCGSPTMNTLRGFRYNSYNIIRINDESRNLEEAYVKVLTGEWKEKNMIPMEEFVKIPPMSHRDFIRSEYAHYLEGYVGEH
ncbi:MAG: metallophosphoesterase family protein [Candidatus Hydrothermarchaeota archaeon]